MVGSRAYDLMYRVGAPWEIGPRSELVELVTSGRLTPGRAIDLGCGSGENAIFLAEHGFEVTGVDFSPVAHAKARRAATASGIRNGAFRQGDLTAAAIDGVFGRYDLLVDYGTLDDLGGHRRRAMAATVHRLSGPGSAFLLWCFYDELRWWRRRGARFPGLKPDEESVLFGDAFIIDRLPAPKRGTGFACFLMVRR